MPILYRGIALDQKTASADTSLIRATGQLAAKSLWQSSMASPTEIRSRLSELVRAPTSIRSEISRLAHTPITYACGDFEGAARYALSGAGRPFVIAVEVNLAEVAIDGKDFLYTVFQMWDRVGVEHRDRVRGHLSTLFGPTMLDWFDRAVRETDTHARIGLCDLAVHDLAAIERHYANRIDIAGRMYRVFRSAFALPANVEPAAILDVQEVQVSPFDPVRTIDLHADMLNPQVAPKVVPTEGSRREADQ